MTASSSANEDVENFSFNPVWLFACQSHDSVAFVIAPNVRELVNDGIGNQNHEGGTTIATYMVAVYAICIWEECLLRTAHSAQDKDALVLVGPIAKNVIEMFQNDWSPGGVNVDDGGGDPDCEPSQRKFLPSPHRSESPLLDSQRFHSGFDIRIAG